MVNGLFEQYLAGQDFVEKNNANMQRSVAGLNLHLRESVTQQYCLDQVYSAEIAMAHK